MITRRAFVRDGAAALVGLSVVPSLPGLTGRGRSGTLVVILQSGGADALSMVVPFRERDYYARRPTIAIPPPGRGDDAAIDLDGTFAFHPRLRPLVPWYRSGRLAVVHACGLPDGPSTHLEARERLHASLQPATARADGRLVGPDPACEPPEGAGYPDTRFGHVMAGVARSIETRASLGTAVVDTRGWDTHERQGGATGALADRLDDLARGLAAFLTDLGDRAADVTVVTLSEFGRSIAENRYGGTDHGRGGVVLALGGGVAGGVVHGAWPGLAPAAPGRAGLTVTTDVRGLFAHLAGAPSNRP